MTAPGISRDQGLKLAIAGAGGLRKLRRAVGGNPGNWTRVPQHRLLEVAKASGVDAEVLRPDLAAWITHQRRRQALDRGRERFGMAIRAAQIRGAIPGEVEAADVLITLAAASFAAEARGLPLGRVLFGTRREEESARSWAQALASVAGRASPTAIAGVYDCSRQNVDNACNRYLRARDGDDPDDVDDDGKVVERGRLRAAKLEPDAALWAAEQKFDQLLQKAAGT